MKISKIFTSFLLTMLLLVVFNILSTVLLPVLGLVKLRVSLNILIIIFMGLRVNHSSLPILILCVQLIQSTFTIEGWAHGTFAGVIVSIVVGSLKEVLHLKSVPVTMAIAFILQLIWYLIESFLVLFRMGDLNGIIDNVHYFLIESVLLSLFSPLLFTLLERIWKSDEESIGVNV